MAGVETPRGTRFVGEERHTALLLLALLAALTLAALTYLLFLAPPAFAALKSNSSNNTVQTDGRVWTILKVGNTVYLGGNFRQVGGQPRDYLAAVDASTGSLKSWNPGANGPVYALDASADGTRIFAGGEFSRVGGQVHNRLAAIDAVTGTVNGDWNASAGAAVRTLEVLDGSLYVGGTFTNVNGVPRARLAAINGSSGTLVRNWRADANGAVHKLKVRGTRLYVGGNFTTIKGRSRRNLAALNASSGLPIAWRPNPERPVIDLAVTRKRVFTAEGGPGGAAAAYGASKGRALWARSSDGDVQAVAVMDGRVYVGGHFTRLAGRSRTRLAALLPKTGKLDTRWTPAADGGVWDLLPDGTRKQLYAGGGFTTINERPQAGFAKFSSR